MLKRRELLFALFAICGFCIMFWSANDWYELMRGERLGASFCNFNSYWNCDRASMSALGSYGSFPLGLFGAAWFWVIGILGFGAARLKKFFKPVLISGLIVCAALATYLFSVLKTGCLVCYLTYFFAIASTITVWRGVRSLTSVRWTWSLLGIGIGILLLFALSNSYRMEKMVSEEEFQKWFQSMPVIALPEISPLQKGDPKAKITVFEFSDFGCPFCEKAASVLTPFFATQDDIRVLFYPFPVDSECNPKQPRGGHAHSCEWSRAALCAQKQNQFWNFHDQVFKLAAENGHLPSVSSAIENFSLDSKALKECMENPETSTQLRQLIDAGIAADVSNTPTFYIAGRKVEGFIGLPYLKRLLLEIRRQ